MCADVLEGVIPAQAGIQWFWTKMLFVLLDSRLRGNDKTRVMRCFSNMLLGFVPAQQGII
jgi:hypothetical protein